MCVAPPEAVAGVEIQETALRGTGYAYFYEMGPGTGTDASIRDFHEEAACLVTLFPLCFFSAGKSPAGLPQGLFQTVELWIPNAKAGPAPNDLWDRTGCIWLYSCNSACSFGARASSRGRAWDWVQVQERSSGSSQGSRAMAPFSQSTR